MLPPDKPAPPWAWRILAVSFVSLLGFGFHAWLYSFIPIPFIGALWVLSATALWLSLFSLVFFAEDYDFSIKDWHKIFMFGDDDESTN